MGPPTVVDGKTGGNSGERAVGVASMGPPTVVDGKDSMVPTPGSVDAQLQWGRRLLSTERQPAIPRLLGLPRRFNGAADCCRRKGTRRQHDACCLLCFN